MPRLDEIHYCTKNKVKNSEELCEWTIKILAEYWVEKDAFYFIEKIAPLCSESKLASFLKILNLTEGTKPNMFYFYN